MLDDSGTAAPQNADYETQLQDAYSNAVIGAVETAGPAEAAAVQSGDLLIAIDDAPVLGIDDLLRLLNHERVNQSVRVSLLRKGERRDRFVIPVERH